MSFRAAWLLAVLIGSGATAAPAPGTKSTDLQGLRLELSVTPRLAPFTELLETPAYIAVALENSGNAPSMSAKPKILKLGHAVRVRYATLTFVSRKGLQFNYEAEIDASIGIATTRLTIPVTVDASNVAKGKLVALLRPPMAGVLPDELRNRIQQRAQQMASPVLQEGVATYLERLAVAAGFSGKANALFVPLLIDSYNLEFKGVSAFGKEPGDAEPLSDQLMLIVTLLIWLVAVPLAIGAQAWRAKRRDNGARKEVKM